MSDKTIKVKLNIPIENIHFITVPEQYKNFRIVNYGFAGKWLMETDSKELNHWKTPLPNGYNYEILGFSRDVLLDLVEDSLNFVLKKVKI